MRLGLGLGLGLGLANPNANLGDAQVAIERLHVLGRREEELVDLGRVRGRLRVLEPAHGATLAAARRPADLVRGRARVS